MQWNPHIDLTDIFDRCKKSRIRHQLMEIIHHEKVRRGENIKTRKREKPDFIISRIDLEEYSFNRAIEIRKPIRDSNGQFIRHQFVTRLRPTYKYHDL